MEDPSLDYYTAAVVEFSPTYEWNNGTLTLRGNTNTYIEYIEKASKQVSHDRVSRCRDRIVKITTSTECRYHRVPGGWIDIAALAQEISDGSLGNGGAFR